MKYIYILFLAILTVVNALCSIPLYAGRDECDDIKMLSQCQQAQMQINEYTNYVINDNYILVKYIPELHCEKHISCKIAYDYDYCQNMDSYDTCVDSRKLLQEFIKKAQSVIKIPQILIDNKPNITCNYDSIVGANGRQDIYNYYEHNEHNANGCFTNVPFNILVVFFCWSLIIN